MLGGRARPDLLRELRRFLYLIFVPQNYQKGLAAGLRPDPLGELERSPRLPSRSALHGREHSLDLRRGSGEGWKYVECVGDE